MLKRKNIIIGLVALLIVLNSISLTEVFAATSSSNVTNEKSVNTKKQKMKVTSKSLSIRKGASTKSKLVAKVKKGQVVNYISTSKNKKWVKVEYEGKTGYAYLKDLQLVKDTTKTSVKKTPVKVLTKSLTIRKGASSKQKAIAKVKKGTNLTVIGNLTSSWVKVEYKGKIGYVNNKNSKYLQKVSTTASEDKAIKTVVQEIKKISSKVTLNDKAQVKKARAAYNKLSSSSKKKVTNLSVLTKAEATIVSLEANNKKEEAKKPSTNVGNVNSGVGNSTTTNENNSAKVETPSITNENNSTKVENPSTEGDNNTVEIEIPVSDPLSEKAKELSDKISKLNREISLSDKAYIESVRKEYTDVEEEVKQRVTNIAILENAEASLQVLLYEKELADNVIAKINALEIEITLDHASIVEEIRNAYENLPVRSKALVSNLEVLEEAEAKVSNLREYAKAEKAAQSYLEELNKLPQASEIELSDKEAVVLVRSQYEQLNAIAKDMISEDANQKLVDAENVITALEIKVQDEANARYVEGLIVQLDRTIVYDDFSLIRSTRKQYNELSAYAKSLVGNLAILEKAEAILDDKLDRIWAVVNLINKIPLELTLQDKDYVVSVREAYEQLSVDEKKGIYRTDLDILIFSEQKIDRLETTANHEELRKFSEAVKALPSIEEITIEYKERILELKKQYYLIDESLQYAVGEEFYQLIELEHQIKLLESMN